MGSTKVDLVQDLENELALSVLLSEEEKAKIPAIIEKAKKGYYHDFESEIATPKTQLHIDLLEAGLPELDRRMQSGMYDDEPPSPEEEKRLMDLLGKEVKNGHSTNN